MILIIGGAYQGKLDFAKETYGLSDEDIFLCGDQEPDFSRRCICALEEFTFQCVQSGRSAVDWFRERQPLWENRILICQEITGGVVPMGADMRAWREETGRLCQYLATQAQQVSRIFCGLEQRLKG